MPDYARPIQIDMKSPDTYRTGPETVGGRYMRQFWLPVALSHDVQPGEVKPLRIMGVNYTLYRGERGDPHVIGERCPHRGTQLSVGLVDGDCVRCLYHGWKFDGDGQCVDIPHGSERFATRNKITGCPTKDHIGLIFAYFGEGEPPAFPHIPGFEGEGIVEVVGEDWNCNFFQSFENDWDEYHLGWTHRTGGIHTVPNLSDETFDETDYGVLKMARKADGTCRTTVFLPPAALRLVVPTPNKLSYIGAGPAYRDTYIFHTPIDDENHYFFVSQHVPVTGREAELYLKHYNEFRQKYDGMPTRELGEEILAGKKQLKDALDHPFFALLEDYIAQVGQNRIADRRNDHLSQTDAGVIFLRKLWQRELNAIANEQPTKSWAILSGMPHPEINQAVLETNTGTGVRRAGEKMVADVSE